MENLTKNEFLILEYLSPPPKGSMRLDVMNELKLQKSSFNSAEKSLISNGFIIAKVLTGPGSPKFLEITRAGKMILKGFKIGKDGDRIRDKKKVC